MACRAPRQIVPCRQLESSNNSDLGQLELKNQISSLICRNPCSKHLLGELNMILNSSCLGARQSAFNSQSGSLKHSVSD